MKFFTTIIILYLLSAGLFVDGGVKVIINQRLIDSLLTFFIKNSVLNFQINKINDAGPLKKKGKGYKCFY